MELGQGTASFQAPTVVEPSMGQFAKFEEATEFQLDYVWSAFSDPDDGNNAYRLLK